MKFSLKPKRGAGMVEYGLLAGLVSVMAIAAVLDTGEEVETVFCVAANGVAEGMGRDAPLDDCATPIAGGGGETGGGEEDDETSDYTPIDGDILMTFTGTTASIAANNVGPGTVVDWGDGSPVEPLGEVSHSHSFPANGTYQVRIAGQVGQLGNRQGSGCLYRQHNLVSIESFGSESVGLTSLECAFFDTPNLQSVAQIPPGVTTIRNLMLNSASNPTGINNWNVSSVTDFSGAFANATVFNQPLDGWDTSSGTTFAGTFNEARAFNQPLSSWDMSSAVDLRYMFDDARIFNQDLSSWDVSFVTNMKGMFDDAMAFNGNIGNWNTSSVIDMGRMFRNAAVFDQDLFWDVSSVRNFSTMFANADNFNSDIVNWRPDTSEPVNFTYMFSNNGGFNQPIGSWNLREPSDIDRIFYGARGFNQDLSSWCFADGGEDRYDYSATAWEAENKPTFNCSQ